jgi:drug/metabolite transporter (DMT)-like permease
VTSVQTGIALALVAAAMANLASLFKHRGCQHVAPVQIRQPLRSARSLAASPWFAAGWGLAAAAWLLHVAALSMAPISLVQAVLAGGAVTLAIMSKRLFGDPIERRQWLALLLGGTGLALLALTLPSFDGSHSHFALAPILGFEGGLALLATGLAIGHRSERFVARRGALLAALAGTLFALAGIAIKSLTGESGASIALVVPWVILIVVCGGLAQYAAVVALQRGGAIETIGLMGLVANTTQIAGGVLVFGDPLSTEPLGIVLQATAFAMVCVSALLLPTGGGRRPTPVAPAIAAGPVSG